jgi:hypothetical protein
VSSVHEEKPAYSQAEHEQQPDLEAAKWAARENGEDVEIKEPNPFMSKVHSFMHSRYATYIRDFGLILLLLGWWIPAIINDTPQVRHRWIPSTIFVSRRGCMGIISDMRC